MFSAVRTFFTRETEDTLRFFLKSGNSFVIDKVTDWTVENTGNEITGIRISQKPDAKNRLLVKTVDLAQIEAVVVEQGR